MLAQGRYVAPDRTEVPRPLDGAPRTRDLLLELHHADVPLGLVVIKEDGEVGDEAQHVSPLTVEADEEVEGLLLVARPLADCGSRIEAEPFGDELSVADPDGMQGSASNWSAPVARASSTACFASTRRPTRSLAHPWSQPTPSAFSSRRWWALCGIPHNAHSAEPGICLLYTSDAADEEDSVD